MALAPAAERRETEARMVGLLMDLRRAGITDLRVLAAIEAVPRHLFVPAPFAHLAYEDTALPLACGQTVSSPSIVAAMCAALALRAADRVLEIGTGSGYQTAVLAFLAARVFTIERHETLRAEAARRLRSLRLRTVTMRLADGTNGWAAQGPFDAIVVSAAAPGVPQLLVRQLTDGGRLVLPVEAVAGRQRLLRLTRKGGDLHEEDLGPVRFVPLVSRAPDAAF